MNKPDTVKVDEELLVKVKQAIDAALSYKKTTEGTRKLGLELVVDSRSEGFDALDAE